MKKFGKRSLKVLSTLHPELQFILREAIRVTDIDFSLIHGYRTPEEQTKLFQKGRNDHGKIVDKNKVVTYKDGYLKLSKHNYYPSLAVDICVYIPRKPGLSYDNPHLCYVSGVITSIANRYKLNDSIDHSLIWGGNWDKDGTIIYDQNFQDLCHFQLNK